MPLVVIAGAPGVGKTTLLAELVRRGHHAISDSAREVIRERKAAGLPPRPAPLEFAREVLKRDALKYQSALTLAGAVFFERSALEALAMVQAAWPELAETDAVRFQFHECVFVLPPWESIYVTDSERDHPFEHALRVHEDVIKFYPALGYRLCEVPRGSPAERADYVLHSLAASTA